MKTLRQTVMKAFTAVLVAMPLWAFAIAAQAQAPLQLGRGASLKQRAVRPKPAKTTINLSKARADIVIVKFREGTHVRENLGQLQADLSNLSDAENRLLQRANLSRQQLFQDLAQVNTLVAPNTNRFVKKLFSRPEAELNADKSAGEANTGAELADLNLYHRILIGNAKVNETERLVDQLNALDIVEIAYPEPIPQVAQADIAPTTSNFATGQGYLAAAATGTNTTNGIDINYARFFPGTRGNDVQIIDVESGWNLSHEDLPPVFFRSGVNNDDAVSHQHGTSVLGVMAAAENAYGMTGIAPQSRIGVSSELDESCIFGFCWQTVDLPDAINKATAALRIGDIMLIELHAAGPDSGPTPMDNCNPDQFEFIAMEFWDANFDAIKMRPQKASLLSRLRETVR